MDRLAFLDQLRHVRLISDQESAQLAEQFGEKASAHAIAAALIADGKLTPFQARELTAGRARGLNLGQYQLLDELGQGGFGKVYKALHTVMNRIVALKVLAPQFAEDSRARGWFRREVLAATQLNHPNIVLAYDANEVEDTLFLVMEYVDGPNLDTLVRREGPLPVSTACAMMRQVCLGLQHAQEKGMVHRDIKPANFLIPRRAPVSDSTATPVLIKVADFGLARLQNTAGAGSLLSENGKGFLGSPEYVSPEQARNAHAADIRSDLYSLGCSFYFALTGDRPFSAPSVFELVVKHLEQDAPRLETLRPDVPPGLAAIIHRLMAKNPARRFQTPAEVIAELAFVAGTEVMRPAPPPPSAPAFRSAPLVARPLSTPENLPGSFATRLVPEMAMASPAIAPGLEYESTELTGGAPTPLPELDPPRSANQLGASEITPTVISRAALPSLPPSEPALPGGPAPTEAPSSPCSLEELRNLWQEWIAAIEFVARGGDARQIHEGTFRELRHRLLQASRSHTSTELGQQICPRLDFLVEPWVTPHSLGMADRETLGSLYQGCLEVRQNLGTSGGLGLLGWLLSLVCFALVVVTGWYLQQVSAEPGTGSGISLHSLTNFVRANPLVAAAPGALVLLIGVWLFRKTTRS